MRGTRFGRQSITANLCSGGRQVIAILRRVFGEARRRFAFEVHGFRLEEKWLSFYIRPADGLQLPAIMQWVK
jgi:hypothetical protein